MDLVDARAGRASDYFQRSRSAGVIKQATRS